MARYDMMGWLVIGCTVAVGCSKSPPPSTAPEDPCHDADLEGKRVWNEETRIRVKAQVMDWKGEVGAEVAQEKAERVETSMDRIADDWARMRRSVCRDFMVREALSKEQYRERTRCLDALLVRQRTFLDSLSTPRADLSEQLTGIGRELDSCK